MRPAAGRGGCQQRLGPAPRSAAICSGYHSGAWGRFCVRLTKVRRYQGQANALMAIASPAQSFPPFPPMLHSPAICEMLGIPHDEQPASHYRLLGVDRQESSAEAIENAAYRQSMRVSAYRDGPWEGSVEPVLQLIDEVRSCLVDPAKRAAYDRLLQAEAIDAAEPDQEQGRAPIRRTQRERAEWTLGASEDCDIVIDDPYVSRRHCRIVREDDRYWIEDLDSCNGTYVDGERVVKRKELSMNDSIGLGKTLRIAWGQFLTMQERKRERPDKPVLVHVARRTICHSDGSPLIPGIDPASTALQPEPGQPAQAND